MYGNVWEWCEDWYDEYYTSIDERPSTTVKQKYKVIRGGSWEDTFDNLRSSYRSWNVHFACFGNVGFRIVENLS